MSLPGHAALVDTSPGLSSVLSPVLAESSGASTLSELSASSNIAMCLESKTGAATGKAGSSTSLVGCKSGGKNSSSRRMWQLDDFELGPCIGSGTFGRVLLARERRSGTVIVLKAMKKRRIERLRVQRHVAHEIEIQAHLRHPNILSLFGFFWDATHIFMIVERAQDEDLYQMLQKQPHQRFEERGAAKFVQQIASAVEYCHRMHVIHRDVKPQNILLGHRMKAKLADFGWAVHTYPDEQRWTLCGTLDYLPPEMVHATHGHSFGVDIWGLGILSYELLTGQPPFAAKSCEETYRRILEAKPAFQEKGSQAVSPEAQSFIIALLRREQAERLRPVEVLAHPWLRLLLHESGPEGRSAEGRGAAALAGG